MLFATVSNRDPEELTKGKIGIQFIEDQDVFGIEKRRCEYQMVESPAYYEAYRHVLKGLKELDETTLPFKKYLVECSEDVDPPEYLRREDNQEPVCYDLSWALDVPDAVNASKVPVLQPKAWPSVEALPLNNSQLEALKTAVTTEFSVIQGPPGTGKTYVGAKIVRCLLENRETWDPDGISPMLMVCYTNHALDQFLEKIASKTKRCQRFNTEQSSGNEMVEELLAKADTELLEFDDLEELLNSEHTEQLYNAIFPDNATHECRTPGNTFKLWLCSNKQMDSLNRISKAETKDQVEKRQDGDNDEGGNDYVFNDATLFTAPYGTDENNNTNNELARNGSWKMALAENPPPKDKFSSSDRVSEKDATKLATQTCHGPKDDFSPEQQEVENVENIIQMEGPQNVKETSGEITEAFEDTITVEKEADFIQYQRCIHGDDNFLPIMEKQSDEFSSRKQEHEDMNTKEEAEWITVSYRKKGETFSWQQTTGDNSKNRKKGTHMVNVQIEEDTTQPKSSKNNKTSTKPIDITADITSLKTELRNVIMMRADKAMGVDNIWLLNSQERLRLYLFWVENYRERYRVEIQRGEQEYEQLCHDLEAVRFEEEEEVIRRATIVGMTTSCAAKYHSVLQRVAPRIVVIEEAAEVMEAHIITSLSRDTKHTILIGDHKQLRPKATVYELAQNYNLEISLFERMVINSMDCKRLCIQHRMRPEIAALTKRIYDHEIVDHESVCEFDDITGVTNNLFFIDHCRPEILGYSRSQITILTMYTGQLLLLQEKMPRRTFGGVKVCAVDNFQGEENDIILLSLVRSNSERRIGFLGESNRICVALSRARQGFYCIGNFSMLSQCKLWKEICDYLQTKNAIGETLQIVCKKHNNVTNVRTSSEFNNLEDVRCPVETVLFVVMHVRRHAILQTTFTNKTSVLRCASRYAAQMNTNVNRGATIQESVPCAINLY
ncbi:NFX1-type zinc finger-containing protein 1 [Desmophyllum pertusum]|uniref:NFX1-type zinc finger-containing protein 1 n=1 Tax=Desmophyllum pertusum TaxID=174260 RepID=A0A9X0D314_9CNID|nr:NFX1-type zinc finger-containing protein 1 [Desmophyllum pertusum]